MDKKRHPHLRQRPAKLHQQPGSKPGTTTPNPSHGTKLQTKSSTTSPDIYNELPNHNTRTTPSFRRDNAWQGMGRTVRVHEILRRTRKVLSEEGTSHRRTPADLGSAAVATMQMSRFFYVFVVFAIAANRFGKGYSGTPTHPLWPIDMLEGLTGTGWFANTTAVGSRRVGHGPSGCRIPESSDPAIGCLSPSSVLHSDEQFLRLDKP